MAEAGAVAKLKDELTCPICLSIYDDPVSLGCGHSFCKKCIQEAHISQQSSSRCPLCLSTTSSTWELKPNFHLRNIVQNFRDAADHQEEEKQEMQCKEEGESSGQQEEVVLCDFCLQEPQAAVKTCLMCEASLCQAHLSKHGTENVRKSHILVEPCGAEFLAKRKCPQHGKLLECYCERDRVCICMLCSVLSSHKDHNIISLEDAFVQAQGIFPEILKKVKKHEVALDQSLANLLKQEEKVKIDGSLQREWLERLFGEINLQLENKKSKILKAVSDYEEQQLSQIQMEIKKHEKEKHAASQDVQELRDLRKQKDQVLFIRAFTAIQDRKCSPVPNMYGVKLANPPFILDDSRRNNILSLFQGFLSNMEVSFKAAPVTVNPGLYQYSQPVNPHNRTFIFS